MKVKGILAACFAAVLSMTLMGCSAAQDTETGVLDEPTTSADETADVGKDAATADNAGTDTSADVDDNAADADSDA